MKLNGKSAVSLIIVAFIYFIVSKLSLLLAVGNSNATSVWPPSAIAIAVLLTRGYWMGISVFAGAFLANLITLQNLGASPLLSVFASISTSAGNTLEAIVGVYLVRRFIGKTDPFGNIRDLFMFIFFASFLNSLISASLGVSSLCFVIGDWSNFFSFGLTWWLGDVTGILIFSPIFIMLLSKTREKNGKNLLFEAVLVFFFLIAFTAIIFWRNYHLEYLVIPPLLWIALRFGRLLTSASVSFVSSVAILSTLKGAGPLTDLTLNESFLYLQTYVSVCSVTALCLSVLMHEHSESELDLRNYKEHLEEIVKERSAYLSLTNEELTHRIQEKEEITRALQESESKYRDLVESANSIILRWKPDGSVTFFNTYAQDFFGFSEKEIMGKSIMDTIVPEREESSGRDLSLLIYDVIYKPQVHIFNENENIKKNGERVWISWANKAIYNAEGNLVEILSVGNDITARKKIEESLQRTLKELELAKEQAEVADRLKSAFLANMSHELRTPLNSIIGFTGIILQGIVGPLNNEQKKQLNIVKMAAGHLLALINDVLDLSKIESGQMTIARESFNLKASVEKVIDSVKPLIEKKGLIIETDLLYGVEKIICDERRVEQVVLNFLSNAIKYTDAGKISIKGEMVGAYVKTSIADTGIGIKKEDIEKLFKPFQQLDSGVARKYEGTGLGLSICAKLVKLFGGEIFIESEFGKGSVFSFTLPIEGKVNEE